MLRGDKKPDDAKHGETMLQSRFILLLFIAFPRGLYVRGITRARLLAGLQENIVSHDSPSELLR